MSKMKMTLEELCAEVRALFFYINKAILSVILNYSNM